VVASLVILALLLLLKILADSPILSIKNLIVIDDPHGKVTPLLTSLTKGKNLLLLPEDKIRMGILKDPQIKSITFDKSFPSTLTAHLSFRIPAVAWQGTNGTFLVDDQGLVFQSGYKTGLTKVITADKLQLSAYVDHATLSKVLTLLDLNRSSIVTITVQKDTYQAVITEGVIALFDPTGDLSQESQALQLIIGSSKIDGKLPRTVDLRFPKPVVAY
jgi:hypothetical protein